MARVSSRRRSDAARTSRFRRGLTIGPVWAAPAIVLLLLIPLSILVPRRHRETRRTRFWSILLIAIVNFFNLASVLLLVGGLFRPEKAVLHSAAILLRTGAQIWATNILVFALWFWELDGDGPDARAHASSATEVENADFLFPQMQMSLASGASGRASTRTGSRGSSTIFTWRSPTRRPSARRTRCR